MSVQDYSTNPDDNLTISGINIAEGMPPGLVNNAIRQLMSDIKVNSTELENGKLSTSGGQVTGNLSIKNMLDLINAAPATEQELGLYLLDKNNNVMGGHDFVHSTGNLKVSQMYARNSNGLISSLGVYVSEDGTRYTLSSHDLVLTSDVRISRLFADNVRLIVFSGNVSNAGYAMRYSPDNGELYLDGRAVHGKADTAGYADTAGSANALGGKAESALSVAFASEAQNSYGLKGMDMIIAKQTYTLPGYGDRKSVV